MNDNDLRNLQKKIGYSFKNKLTLIKALTHPSCEDADNNQFLEYLGDSLLDFLVADYLYFNYPELHEGEATKIRARIVSRWPLARLYDSFELSKVILVRNVGISSMSVKLKSDFVESLLGAIYVDGGIEYARKFVVDFLCKNQDYTANPDFKSKLYEYGAKHQVAVSFDNRSEGVQHKQHFYSVVYLDGVKYGSGEGNNKREAEQQASKIALEKLNDVRS